MTETQQRFLRAIAERVPTEQVVELHLFPPIRQGGVETGVAVVAEDPRHALRASREADGTSDGEQVEVGRPSRRSRSDRRRQSTARKATSRRRRD